MPVSAGEFGPAVVFSPFPLTSRYLTPLMTPSGVSVSEAVLFAGLVSDAPGSRSTDVFTLPEPVGSATLAPAEATDVQVALSIPAGNMSVTVAPVTAAGPLFLTTIV